MDFTYSEDQQAISELATQIINDHSAPETLRALERSGEPRFNRDLWSKLAEAGLLGLSVPEESGGAGLTLLEAALVIQASGTAAAAIPIWETLGLGLPALLGSDNPAAREWISTTAAGETVLTGAWHQGEAIDAENPTVSASSAGLTGTASCVPALTVADAVIVPARVEGTLALYLVATDAPGVSIEPIDSTYGTPDGNLELNNAQAIELVRGDDAVHLAFDHAVALQCALLLGHCESALALTAQYTKDRKQFGVPLASFQAVGHRAADTFIDTQGIRLTTNQALWRLSTGVEASEQVAIAKFWASYGGYRVVHAATHLHGGVGVDRDYPLHRHFLAVKQYELQLGGATPSLLRLGASIAANA